jgi:hypothetical protein
MKSLTNKLTLCVLVVGCSVGVADAATVLVFEAPLDNWGQDVSADFAVDRELGRAWVDVVLTTNTQGDEPVTREASPRHIDGLYYDAARKQVLYRSASETIVCAEDSTFLWRTYLKSTGSCLFSPRIEKRKIDDGFHIHEKNIAKVVFEVQPADPTQHAVAPGRSNQSKSRAAVY